jgi:hypothetical protein
MIALGFRNTADKENAEGKKNQNTNGACLHVLMIAGFRIGSTQLA